MARATFLVRPTFYVPAADRNDDVTGQAALVLSLMRGSRLTSGASPRSAELLLVAFGYSRLARRLGSRVLLLCAAVGGDPPSTRKT